jgi:calcium/calmodulin-dependent protein kinase I
MSNWTPRGSNSNSLPNQAPAASGMATTFGTSSQPAHHTQRPPVASPQPVLGYHNSTSTAPQTSSGLAMDLDQDNQSKFPFGSSPNQPKVNAQYRRSRQDNGDTTLQDHRSRSNRSSSRGSNQSHHPPQSLQNGAVQPFNQAAYQQQRPAPTNAATSAYPPTYTSSSPEPTFPPPAVTSESPPSTQPRRPAYLLHRDLVIGKGSYGQVCIASRGEPEGHRAGKRKKFACKCVMLRNDPKYIAKLQEEVNVLRELRGHQNVIRLYDVFCVDNELFIITELGRGGDLFHLLTTHPKHGVTESYAAKTVAEMLSAVAFLHSRTICHRDLKLENWVLESGKDVWSSLKLIDFGLSTHFTPGQRLSRVVGSSYYVAPEVLKKSYTEACDLWSLGVIVYMLLSGAPPFYGKNDEAIKASIVQGEYTFPHELFRDVSDEAMAFVSTLLSYNTEYRYTAEQALTHPWLAANLDPNALQKAKDGARGIGIAFVTDRPDPMQL